MSLEDDGFFVHRAVIDEPGCAHLREVFSSLQPANGAGLRDPATNSEEVAALSFSSEIRSLLTLPNMVLVRSLLFDKTPESNWPVAWHQDRTIAVKKRLAADRYGPWSVKGGIQHVEPPAEILDQMVTLRVHLDSAGESKGALRVAPGTHLAGKIPPDAIRSQTETRALTVSCHSGDVLAMKPLLLHSSRRAEKPSHLRVIHLEYAPENVLPGELEWHCAL